ncbi:NADPH:quinone oxidoreductase family protein [Bailinhaonella thermotolerans]|uniref:NADPH:quinone oxidoreductase family protein n=1 Tax=Bailinhaonella thermotolerans TaxID=1070861 RepID=A0A3A4BI76_9ACTN|nr:NADPH:quinone oxidoreductase family protein [Bailinhaonella thermotolerans]RJL30952.1 NADPH:quinone oxidoreductase family protein [Bailinhaonella thermotolerans]
MSRAIVCAEFGPPEKLTLTEVDTPVPGPGQVLVAVEAAGVNYVDGLMVGGGYQLKPPLPFTPGSEVAGVITAGDGPVGTRVVVFCGLGGFATHVVVPAAQAVPVPDDLDVTRAATFIQSYSTALYSLRDRGGLREGERVLVLGAGGGVGLAAVQVAKAMGADVLAGASSAAKRALAREAGADEVLDTAAEDVKAVARAWGVDVVVDPVGGPLAEAGLRALREGGRFLVVGFASGTIPALPLNQVLLRNRSVVGVDWGAWSMSRPADQAALLSDLLGMAAGGLLTPVAPEVRPLAEAGRAMADLLARRTTGKIALVP